jgi:hypothetical protein
MEYGMPVVFEMRRAKRSKLNSRTDYVGILHGCFTQNMNGNKVQRAKVYCAVGGTLHTCDLSGVKTLDDKSLDAPSLVILTPDAIARTAPKELIIRNHQVTRIKFANRRSRFAHLLTMKPTEWPKDYVEQANMWPPTACWLNVGAEDDAQFGKYYIEVGHYAVRIRNDTSIPNIPNDVDRVYYDPALEVQPWEKQTTDYLINLLARYKSFAEELKIQLKNQYEERRGTRYAHRT